MDLTSDVRIYIDVRKKWNLLKALVKIKKKFLFPFLSALSSVSSSTMGHDACNCVEPSALVDDIDDRFPGGRIHGLCSETGATTGKAVREGLRQCHRQFHGNDRSRMSLE